MREIETFYVDRKCSNMGYIFFDDYRKAVKMKDKLQQFHIGYKKYLVIDDGRKYYGFKAFVTNKKFFNFCIVLKEVLE